jgi:hypothetical protein
MTGAELMEDPSPPPEDAGTARDRQARARDLLVEAAGKLDVRSRLIIEAPTWG